MTAIAPHTRAQAKALRRMMTPQERRLWQHLRDLNRQLGLHFRRQAPVGPFIADFCDFGRRLVIELDGLGHGGPRDARRDGWFQAQGFDVLRFWNADVDGNPDGVMQRILDAIETGPSTQDVPAPSPSGPCPDPASRPGNTRAAPSAPYGGRRASPPPHGEGGSRPTKEDHP
jgi:very-short-patch-repair endonuclease